MDTGEEPLMILKKPAVLFFLTTNQLTDVGSHQTQANKIALTVLLERLIQTSFFKTKFFRIFYGSVGVWNVQHHSHPKKILALNQQFRML